LYYTAINIDRGKSTATQGTKQGGSQEDELTKQGDTVTPKPNSAAPIMRENVAELPTVTGSGDAKRDSKTQAVAGLANDIYSGSRGDMINLKIKIIGDPTFIKQDDIFINPGQAQYNANVKDDPVVTKNNSIRTDTGEIHCLVEFYSPTDRDEYTGLLAYEGRWRRSLFSGIYRILTVESTFSKGKFEQSLDMIRLFNQPEYDYEIKREADISKERQPDQPNEPAADTEPQAVPETAGFTTRSIDGGGGDQEQDEDEDFSGSDELEEEDPGDEPELLNPEDEDEFNELNDDLEDAEEQDIDDWDEEANDDAEEEEAVLDDEDAEEDGGSDAVDETLAQAEEAQAEVQANAEEAAELEAEANALAADMSSPDPAVRQRAAEAFLNGPASSLATSAQGFVTLTEDLINGMKTAQASAEFQEKATDQEKADVAAAIAEMENDLPKVRQAAADALASLQQAKAELAANPISTQG
jgi:hypothetical protein